uniref:Putative hexose transporter n=1 Tax=Davidia involucrata TaxID=16924 RepID=A0A5B7AYM6_DAVIN
MVFCGERDGVDISCTEMEVDPSSICSSTSGIFSIKGVESSDVFTKNGERVLIDGFVIINSDVFILECGNEHEGKEALKKIRGVDNVDVEFEQIKMACDQARLVKHPFKKFMKRSSMPH